EILHQFYKYRTSHTLWKALEDRNEGNDKLRKIKAQAIKKEFESFVYIGNESLDELITRFYHLLSEMDQYKISVPSSEIVTCLVDALPPKWNAFVLILKQTPGFEELTLHELIQKLQE